MFIGIDLGTSAVKLLLVDKKGEIIKSVSRSYPLMFPQEGWAEQNPDDWILASFEGIEELIEGYEDVVEGISFSGQMHGLVILDEEDKVIRPALLWCDQRTEEQCEKINKAFGEELIKFTGNTALTGFTAPKLLWIKENEPENFKRIRKIMLPKDYLAFKLSGKYSTDVSDASGTLLLNVKERKWSQDILKFLGVAEEQLPRLYESYEVVGDLNREVKERLRFMSTPKIVAGAGDQAAGAIGVGVVKPGILSVALGTSGVVFASSDHYVADPGARLHSFCHGNGEYHQMGVMLSAAASLKWWIEEIQGSKDYELLVEREAKEAKGDSKLFFLPYLMGERTPHNNPDARGSFSGLNIQHRRGDITRALLEGIVFGLRDSLELIKGMDIDAQSARVSGGGAKSSFWRQLIADIFNLKIDVVNSTEGPAYGAAILAMVGAGHYSDVYTACEDLIEVVDSKYPSAENREFYEEKYKEFRDLYPLLNKK